MRSIRKSVLAMGLASLCMVSGSALSVDNAKPIANVLLEPQQNDSTYVGKIMNCDNSSSLQPVSSANQDYMLDSQSERLDGDVVSNKSKKLGINNYAGGALGILGTLAFGVQAARYGVHAYELSKIDVDGITKEVDGFISDENLPEWLRISLSGVGGVLKSGMFKSELYSVKILQGVLSGLCGIGSALSACFAYKSFKGDINPDLVDLLRLTGSLVDIAAQGQ